MGPKKSLVEVTHDEGYGDSLLLHINNAFGGKDMRAEKIVASATAASKIEGIPEGWELVRVGVKKEGDYFIDAHGNISEAENDSVSEGWAIIRKTEKPKQYRPFANGAEFEPHRDRWIKRSYNGRHNAEGAFRVSGYDDCAVWSDGGVRSTYQEMFDDGRQFDDDGTPFGVEVTE